MSSKKEEKDLLSPQLMDPYKFLGLDGGGFYIPAYQRNFAWGKEHTNRFFESFVDGVNNLLLENGETNQDGIIFMGTVVCFLDVPEFKAVHPVGDYPERSVNVLVDGQQRITLWLTLAQLFHNYLRENPIKNKRLNSLKIKVMKKLESMFLADKRSRYPRLIRGPKDCWLKSEREKTYKSPISFLLSSYTDFLMTEERDDKPKKFNPPKVTGDENLDFYKVFSSSQKIIKNHIAEGKDLASKNCPFNEYPEMEKIFSNQNIMKALWGVNVMDDMFKEEENEFNETSKAKKEIDQANKDKLIEAESRFEKAKKNLEEIENAQIVNDGTVKAGKDQLSEIKKEKDAIKKKMSIANKRLKVATEELKKARAVSRCILAASYFMNRIKFISITTKNQDYAFSIFDSLNTTGDPLTAYETFKPVIVSSFDDIQTYDVSAEKEYFEEIDSYLNVEVKKQSTKNAEFISSFALAETGDKLSKNLPEQRKYLLDSYKGAASSLNVSDHREQFVRQLLRTAQVNESFVKTQEREYLKFNKFLHQPDCQLDEEQKRYSREAQFCLEFLIFAGHTISIALISQFYARALDANTLDSHLELCKVIRSVAAFFALWKSSRLDGEGIDSHHRKIMHHTGKGFARRKIKETSDFGSAPIISSLVSELQDLLGNGDRTAKPIKEVEEWIEHSKIIPIYNKSKHVARFILLLSIYGTKYQQRSLRDNWTFNRALWTHKAHESIEHIIPQASEIDQSPDEKDLIHSIGNLTLLPMEINSFLGNKPWHKKKIIYYLLAEDVSSEDKAQAKSEMESEMTDEEKEEVQRIIEEYEKENFPLFLPAMNKLSDIEEFDFEVIKERSQDILKAAWPILKNWLDGS